LESWELVEVCLLEKKWLVSSPWWFCCKLTLGICNALLRLVDYFDLSKQLVRITGIILSMGIRNNVLCSSDCSKE
jgi:hypothetical protein